MIPSRGEHDLRPLDAVGKVTVERPPPLHHVLVLGRLDTGMEVGGHPLLERRVGDLHVQPIAQLLQLVRRHLLDLVRRVARLEVAAERPALDRLGEDDGGRAVVLYRGLVRGVDLAVVVATTREPLELLVGKVLHHLSQARISPEEVLTDVPAGFHRVLLELAVDRRVHLVDEHAVDVTREELVPLATPDHLDDVPAHAPERRLELLDDLAVAAHRPVEPLQVAVHDEDQVVEPLAPREIERSSRLGLVELTVADETPHACPRRVDQLAVVQIPIESRLVDRVQRPEPHRHRRELPECRQPARVRVRRQTLAGRLPPEVVELLLGQPALEKGTGVDARCGVALDEHLVAVAAVALPAEEVIEADLVQRGRRRVRGEVPAEAVEAVVGAVDHRDRVPAHEGANAALEELVAGEPRFLLGRDRVDVVGGDHRGHRRALVAGTLHQTREEIVRTRFALDVDDAVE